MDEMNDTTIIMGSDGTASASVFRSGFIGFFGQPSLNAAIDG
jgi:hypothetical protein